MIQELKVYEYEERLTRLNLASLKTRRLRGDQTKKYKIVKGFDKQKEIRSVDFTKTVQEQFQNQHWQILF